MSKNITPFELRQQFVELMRKDLVGPIDGPEEEIPYSDHKLSERYLLGALAPGKISSEEEFFLQADEAIIGSTEETDEANDKPASLFGSLLPSSAGMSFLVDGAETAINIKASWGEYEYGGETSRSQKKVNKSKKLLEEGEGEGNQGEEKESSKTLWKRRPISPDTLRLQLKEGLFREEHLVETRDVILSGRIQRKDELWHISLFISNNRPAHIGFGRERTWIFQVELCAFSTGETHRPIFVEMPAFQQIQEKLDSAEQKERADLELRYKHCHNFAKGHGCAVQSEEDTTGRVTKLSIDFLPISIVNGQTPRSVDDDPLLDGICLDMGELAEIEENDLFESLEKIATSYEVWVKQLCSEDERLEAKQRAKASALRALQRIREGIDVLRTNPKAMKAFRFANRAMYLQRIHGIFSMTIHKKQNEEMGVTEREKIFQEIDEDPSNHSWRLFQLAFLLLNIPSLSNPLHEDRSSEGNESAADLLWFSTGGGKTEAYLGLTAFTLAMRRLQGDLGGLDSQSGVAVFMRYTLRLLTLQQFQRAAALICACELLRQEDEDTWGKEPFRLGLWVGAKSTPNTLDGASSAITNGTFSHSSPYQIRICPWCGSPIRSNNIEVKKGVAEPNRCITFCSSENGDCPFCKKNAPFEGIPVMVVDEEIYRRPPSFLISTVDKFAQMPWKGQTAMLFGRVEGKCPRHGFTSPDIDEHIGMHHNKTKNLPQAIVKEHSFLRPPDLIIQDELHLISGPLGSMVALYENAIDILCEWTLDGKTVRPKIVASTATIRRAEAQIRQIFNRHVEVFPPAGTDSRTNFFSIERAISPDSPGRVYIGICPIGHRIPPSAVRVYATAMAIAQKLFNDNGEIADPWMTTVGYFNSVRELAGMRRLVEDEVRGRLKDKFQRGGLAQRTFPLNGTTELTSRQSSEKIPEILDILSTPFKVNYPTTSKEKEDKKQKGPRPYDVVLATNMISVGVDVDRLGLMIVHGQPKTTSEYIQASSRIGRSKSSPGIVLTLYNWARPRDMSHFENFYIYHKSFQRYVEALSVTPFASRALDRGLAAVFVSLIRLLDLTMNENLKSQEIEKNQKLIEEVITKIVNRVIDITDDDIYYLEVKARLNTLYQEWIDYAKYIKEVSSSISYKSTTDFKGLLKDDSTSETFYCPSSLRDVEDTSKLLLNTYDHNLLVRE